MPYQYAKINGEKVRRINTNDQDGSEVAGGVAVSIQVSLGGQSKWDDRRMEGPQSDGVAVSIQASGWVVRVSGTTGVWKVHGVSLYQYKRAVWVVRVSGMTSQDKQK